MHKDKHAPDASSLISSNSVLIPAPMELMILSIYRETKMEHETSSLRQSYCLLMAVLTAIRNSRSPLNRISRCAVWLDLVLNATGERAGFSELDYLRFVFRSLIRRSGFSEIDSWLVSLSLTLKAGFSELYCFWAGFSKAVSLGLFQFSVSMTCFHGLDPIQCQSLTGSV